MSKFLDTNIENKSKTVKERIQFYNYDGNKKLPLPTEIEISESGTCNRKCSFCPRSDPNFLDKKEFISDELYLKLCNELSTLNYAGTIRFSGFVEPMLDKNIYKLINITKNKIPLSNIEMVTNGDVLNLNRLKKLFKSGLNKILISVYDSRNDADKFELLCKNANLKTTQYIIRHRYLPQESDFGITLSNRAGLMENAVFKIKSLKEPLKKKCFIPSYTFFLDYQGDVLMCPHDWGKKMILGNLKEQKFLDIWFNKKSLKLRRLLNSSNRNFEPCNKCDVDGTLMGEINSSYF
jgi:radical SAM protein with 4Fe4S-binding SPASM domain